LRTAYGITTNRPEFREVAPYVYYDFETFSNFEGNPNLTDATIHNVDLRYEFYPTKNEMISFGGFYKKFVNPIEHTFYYAGGQYQYTYMNAHSAVSYGLELDIRKSLDFMKLKNFSLVLNAALLKSKVLFPKESIELDRAMQGQSPFIVNTGLYYDNKKIGLVFSILYNVIGKRIVAVGKANQDANENLPDVYQMPRHSLDASIQQQAGKFKIYISVRNILNQKNVYTQLGKYTAENMQVNNFSQNTKVVKTGVQITTGFTVSF
jgi:outer membrane receptor protein involved in Fe transport